MAHAAASTPPRRGAKGFVIFCSLALLGNAFYSALVHRLAIALYASSSRSATLTQLHFTLLTATSSQRDFHPQMCANAGRTKKKPNIFLYRAFVSLVDVTVIRTLSEHRAQRERP